MNKGEFIKSIAAKAEMTQKAVKEMLDVMQEVVYEEMANGEEVQIFDSVTLLGKEVPERTARNPQTGAEIVDDDRFVKFLQSKKGFNNLRCFAVFLRLNYLF